MMRNVAQARQVELRLLGRFTALRGGIEIPPTAFGGRKVRTLVKVLACRQGAFVSNDALAEALWQDRLPADPAANLQVLVNRARRALGDSSVIITGQAGYTLAPEPICVVDAEHFLALLDGVGESAAVLHEALSLWHGEPLPEEAYDEWAAGYRSLLFRHRQRALERAAALALDQGDVATAVELATPAVEAEPLREIAVLTLMEALAAGGDGAAALLVYDEYRRSLAEELGVDPSGEAVAVYQRLLHSGSTAGAVPPRRRGRRLGQLAFVGRGGELDRIAAALATPPGQGVTVVVTGASGAGKSRLLDELARDVPMVRVRACLPERGEAWTLLRSALREIVAQDLGYVAGLPAPMASALRWLLPELAPEPEPALDPETRRTLLHEAAIRLFAAANLVVGIDDLQWADPSSVAALEGARARVRDLRLIVTVRSEELGEGSELESLVGPGEHSVRIELGALTEDAVADLVGDEGVVSVLCRHTDRTPMAVTEVLRGLAAEGLITARGAGRWRVRDADITGRARVLADEGQRRAIAARVAAQSPGDREVLAVLALLGREAALPLLAGAAGAAATRTLDSLARLHRHGLVRWGDQGWATGHDMVTEVVSAGLDVVERCRVHAAVAAALGPHGDPLVVAHHRRGAGDLQGAVAAYARAALDALDAGVGQEAVHLADVALGLAPDDAAAASLREIRGRARYRLGDIAGARADLRAALAFHPSGPERAKLLAQLATVASGADDLVRAAQLAELAVVEAGDHLPVRARALEVASVLDMNLDRAGRAERRALAALSLYERLGDANGMARILDARAMARFLDGDIREGETALRRAADLFEDSGDLVRVVTPRSTAGHALVFAGDAERGLDDITAALEVARTLGHPEGQTYALWHRAEALAALGRADEATVEAAEALAIARRIGHRGWTATGWRAVGLAAVARGEPDAALHAFRSSLDASGHLGLFASWAAARAAMLLALSGDVVGAEPLARRALREGPPLGHYEARWAQVEVAAARDDPAAGALAQAALGLLDSGGVRQGRERLLAVAQGLASSGWAAGDATAPGSRPDGPTATMH